MDVAVAVRADVPDGVHSAARLRASPPRRAGPGTRTTAEPPALAARGDGEPHLHPASSGLPGATPQASGESGRTVASRHPKLQPAQRAARAQGARQRAEHGPPPAFGIRLVHAHHFHLQMGELFTAARASRSKPPEVKPGSQPTVTDADVASLATPEGGLVEVIAARHGWIGMLDAILRARRTRAYARAAGVAPGLVRGLAGKLAPGEAVLLTATTPVSAEAPGGVLEDEQVHAGPVHHAEVGEFSRTSSPLLAEREHVQRACAGATTVGRTEHDLGIDVLDRSRRTRRA